MWLTRLYITKRSPGELNEKEKRQFGNQGVQTITTRLNHKEVICLFCLGAGQAEVFCGGLRWIAGLQDTMHNCAQASNKSWILTLHNYIHMNVCTYVHSNLCLVWATLSHKDNSSRRILMKSRPVRLKVTISAECDRIHSLNSFMSHRSGCKFSHW